MENSEGSKLEIDKSKSRLLKIDIQEDLYLEIGQEKHLQIYYEAVIKNRDFLLESIPYVTGYDLEKAKTLIQLYKKGFEEGTRYHYFLIYRGNMIGSIQLLKSQEGNAFEIGYWLAEDMNGKGITTICCQQLIKLSFEQLKTEKILITCSVTNTKSQNVAKRLGLDLFKVYDEPKVINDKQVYIQQYEMNLDKYSQIQSTWERERSPINFLA